MAEKFPFPRKGGGNPGHNPGHNPGNPHGMGTLPKMPASGPGSNGADGMRTVPTNAETRSRGPKGGKVPNAGTTAGLPRRSSS